MFKKEKKMCFFNPFNLQGYDTVAIGNPQTSLNSELTYFAVVYAISIRKYKMNNRPQKESNEKISN